MNFENKNVLVYGTGISGISAVSLLEGVQARVILYDENTKLTKEQVKAKLPEDSKAKIVLGVLSEDLIETLDMVVVGGTYGIGKRGDFVGSYLVALRDENDDFKSIAGRNSNGISHEVLISRISDKSF